MAIKADALPVNLKPRQQMTSTALQVAEWMAKEVRATGELHQKEAAATIADNFSGGHVHPNPKGNLAISKAVLVAFRELTRDDVLWIRGRRFWRLRGGSGQAG